MKVLWSLLIFSSILGCGLALKCQVCTGTDGKCTGVDDPGESQECSSTTNVACAFISGDNYDTFRRCEFYDNGREPGCDDDEKTGIDGTKTMATMCACKEDNCNTNDKCSCAKPVKCRVCGKKGAQDGFKCTSYTDNGNEQWCPGGFTCFYHEYENGETYRGCTFKHGNETCFKAAGDGSMRCQCDGKECNKDENCSCGAATITFSLFSLFMAWLAMKDF